MRLPLRMSYRHSDGMEAVRALPVSPASQSTIVVREGWAEKESRHLGARRSPKFHSLRVRELIRSLVHRFVAAAIPAALPRLWYSAAGAPCFEHSDYAHTHDLPPELYARWPLVSSHRRPVGMSRT